MPWIADLHIHSHFSIATSKESNPHSLHRWAGLKGVSLVGTGDFTHPGWRKELREELIPAEPGFYRLAKAPALGQVIIPGQPDPRFVVTGELSTIYKKNGRVRKVHHLIVLPSLEAADRISDRLEALGMNIRSDGRPILGLDSANLLELVLEAAPDVIFIPAHIWTPHFSVFGSNSGFDRMEECYEDLTQYIFAVETGLSSDPGMNWRCSALDRYTLVSNSDAHNPQNLAREANLFETEFSYSGIRDALRDKASGKFKGTLEFFPEEGKYHCDGHRNCNLVWDPEETQAHGGICPVCNRKVTIGVWNRVVQLADRSHGYRPEFAPPYENLVRLQEVIGSALACGPASRKVEQEYFHLLHKLGPELTILRDADLDIIGGTGGPLIAEGIRKLRAGNVEIKPGYDGEYGVIQVLNEADRKALQGQAALFESARTSTAKKEVKLRQSVAQVVTEARGALDVDDSIREQAAAGSFNGLSEDQLKVINTNARSVIVCAGPGTGKTRTLVERIAHLVNTEDVNPAEITGVTFTNKAAAELKSRIGALLHNEKKAHKLNLGTFHSIAWRILNQNPEALAAKLLDETEARDLIEEVLRQNRFPMTAREASLVISLMKNKYLWTPEVEIPGKVVELYQSYQQSLQDYQRFDFDDVLIKAVELWEQDPSWLAPYKKQFQHLFIDEFQDISLIQYKLTQSWMKDSQSVLIIGDPNQAIYGFRGATPRFFERLREDYPATVYYQLTRNYRSAPVVVEAANALIEPVYRQEISLRPQGISGDNITWFETPSEKSASRAIVSEILSLLGGSTMLSAHGQGGSAHGQGRRKRRKFNTGEGTLGFNDFAVLYRTGRQAESLEEALASEGLPDRVVGQTSTFEATPVKEFLAFFRYLYNPRDRFSLRAALRYPRWNLSGAEIGLILQHLSPIPWTDSTENAPSMESVSPMERELEIQWRLFARQPELKPITERLSEFYGVAQYYTSLLHRPNLEIIEDWMLRMTPGQALELEHLKRISENYQGLEDLLRFLPLKAEADVIRKGRKTSGTEMITLSSIHASKGLEFPVVFITGVEEGLLPYGGDPDPETVAEEQRLFYVGLTRAKERLYLVNSLFRLQRNENLPVAVSRFLNLIPEGLLEKVDEQTRSKKQKQLELF